MDFLRITLLARLANHGIELGFRVSNGDYHYCRSNAQNQKASTISQVADGIGPEYPSPADIHQGYESKKTRRPIDRQ
jgi:hypothetical protein